jgi:hypothetical protein
VPVRPASTTRWDLVAAALPLLLAAAVYWPITRSYFYADDFVHLASIHNDTFLRFVLRPYAGHNLVVRNLVFYASARLFGLRADLFFWTVLLTHLLNVWLLFRVLRALTASGMLASFGAALWGTSPAHVGTLGWYSVYGQALVATALLVALEGVTRLARTGDGPSARAAGTWYVLLLLSSACFGVGIGVAIAFPTVLFLLLPAAWHRRRIRMVFLTLPLATVAFYLSDRYVAALLEPFSLSETVATRISFERVLASRRVLAGLLAAGIDSSLRSFFFSYSLLLRAVTLAIFGAGVLVLLWRRDAAIRRTVLAMTLLCLGVYAPIALGRSGLIDPTLLVNTTRYHYVGSLPIVILACLVLAHLGRTAIPPVALLLAALALGVFGWARSDFRIDDHGASRASFAAVLRRLDVEIASHPREATVFLDNGKPLLALVGPFLAAGSQLLFPGRAAAFLLAHDGDELDGRRVRFVERDPAVVAWYARFPDTPLARLLVPPNAVPRS